MEQTVEAAHRIEAGAAKLNEELTRQLGRDSDIVLNQLTSIGTAVSRDGPSMRPRPGRSHFAEV